VYLNDLILNHFKNYGEEKFHFSPSINFLSGENGSGKTNVLDAIHYLCLGKSYFHGNDLQAVKHGEEFFRIDGSFQNGDDALRIACTFQSGKKEISKNKVVYSRLTDHVGLLPVVMIAPDDHSLIDGGSEERRRFIDNTISQVEHPYLEDLVSYNKVLQQRNAALKQFTQKRTFDAALIETLDQQLASFGSRIFKYREAYLKMLIPAMERFYASICNEREKISASYDSLFYHSDFMSLLKASIEKDRVLERTTEGIHRDEFDFFLNDRSVKKFGSQGQKKSFLMALKLSQWDVIRMAKEKNPLLLLDDVFDKLDVKRAGNILELIAADDVGQVFITDANAARIKSFRFPSSKKTVLFELHEGKKVSEEK
jgi:DNA replication and repair protein RecF